MSSLDLLLLELLQMAETPVYSAYGWIGRRLGRPLSMPSFIVMVQSLIDKQLVRLWAFDVAAGEAKELHGLPADLEKRYTASGHTDQSYDPFGLSLTLGSKADLDVQAEWGFDLDFERGTFQLDALPSSADAALRQIASCFPDVEIVPETTTRDGRGARIAGRIQPRDVATPGAGILPR